AEQLLEHASVLRERHVPDAVPRGDEIVGPRRLPLADVGEVEAHLRMPPSRELEHPRGKVEAFDLEPTAEQELDEPAARAAAHVERGAGAPEERERPLVRSDAVVAGKPWCVPDL